MLCLDRRLVGVRAIRAGEAVESGQYGVEVGLDVLDVVLVGEGRVAKDAEERVAPPALARLDHPDVFGQVGHERRVRVVHQELLFGLFAHEGVGEDHLALRGPLLIARDVSRSNLPTKKICKTCKTGSLFVQYLCGILGQLCHLENCILSTLRQMPQMITNIPR